MQRNILCYRRPSPLGPPPYSSHPSRRSLSHASRNLAAAILAALEDTVDASHTAIESITVTAANGSAEVVKIEISRKETVSGGTPARAASNSRVIRISTWRR
jgi:hypothetical protein